MGNWAENAAAKLQQREEYQKSAEELALRREGRIRSEAPYIWDALKEELAKNVREFSTLRPNILKIDPLVQHRTSLEVHAGSRRTLRLAFDASVPTLSYTLFQVIDAYAQPAKSEGRFAFVSDQDVSGVWLMDGSNTRYGVPAAAENLLNMLIE